MVANPEIGAFINSEIIACSNSSKNTATHTITPNGLFGFCDFLLHNRGLYKTNPSLGQVAQLARALS